MMSSKEEETLRFFHYVEESGIRAYNGLLAQNLDHARNERNRTYLQEKKDKKRKQEEAIKRTGEDTATEGKHLRMGSMTMPAPQERMPVPHPHALACGPGFSVRSQSLHSVGGGEEEVGSPTNRKQPPPKPRRDPATKLSMSSEAVDHSPTSTCRGERCDAAQGCSEDCRRVPPPKPKRNPNTQLSVSFDESYIKSHGCSSKPLHHAASPCERYVSQSDESPTDDCEDEPVYIEMGGIDVGGRGGGGEPSSRSEDEEPGESVYEEMKYPVLDDMEYRSDPVGCRSACPTPAPYDPEPLSRCSTPRNIPLCDIPAPFPNLLTHRPPLLVFPPAPAQCSPNSDESPLTPMDVTKLPMLESESYSKSPTSSSGEPPPPPPSSARLRRELTATPTLTVSGRSSAPPLPCTLYKSSASSSSYQRSHSACPSPVSMGRCLTPLSLMRTPPFDAPMPFPGGLPRSASATPHGKGSPPQDGVGRLHGSMQNVSTGRSRTPTSPLDELTNLFTTGRNMLKKNTSGRKSKEPGETESKSKSHSESKREGKERHSHSKESKQESKERHSHSKESKQESKERHSHSKESKRESKERHSKESSHRRDGKDRGCSTVEPLPHRRNSKDRGCSSVEPLPVCRDSRDRGCSSVEPILVRRDSKDRGCSSVEPIPLMRRDSKERGGSNGDLMPRRDSKDRSGGHGMESLVRQDSKDRERLDLPPELLPRQDSKERMRNGLDCRHESRERLLDPPPDLLPRQESKERSRNSADPKHESRAPPELLPRQDSKERARGGVEHRHDGKEHPPELLPRQDSKERARNGMEHRHDGRIDQPPELLPRQDSSRSGLECRRNSKDRYEGRDRSCYNGADPPPPPLPRQDSKDLSRTGLEVRRDSKDRSLNGSEQHRYDPKDAKSPNGSLEYRRNAKERGYSSTEATPRRDNRDRANYSVDQSKAQERNGGSTSGQQSSTATPTRHGRPAGSPPMALGSGSELKPASKYGRSPSIPATPSPVGTPQRKAAEAQMPQMPWMCGDNTMLEQIERKRTLCKEIRSRQHPHLQRSLERPPAERNQERSQCKQESAPIHPGWGKSNGSKKIRPPPYPTQTTVFWDTAI